MQGYDYTQAGIYFVTICTRNRACLFGDVVDGIMQLNDAGQIAAACWRAIPDHFRRVWVDEFVVMPNHVHGILVFIDNPPVPVGATHASPLPMPRGPAPRSLGAVIGAFKSAVTKRIHAWRNTPGAQVWQRNYYEHVIRNEESLNRIRQYIVDNPVRWAFDRDNPTVREPEPENAWQT